MRKMILGVTVVALAAMSAPALAQPMSLDGFYAGVDVGGVSSSSTVKDNTGGQTKIDLGLTGISGGVFAGYGMSWSSIYAGLEAEYELANTNGRATIDSGYGYVPYSLRLLRPDVASVSARLGYYVAKDTLLYGKAGLTIADWAVSDNSPDAEHRWANGLRLGVGMDHALMSNIFLRLSYDLDLSKANYGSFGVNTDAVTQTAKIGVAYKF